MQELPLTTPTDVRDVLAGESSCVRRSLELLGEILSGASESGETDETFRARCLGAAHTALVCETAKLSVTRALSVGAVLADLIALHAPTIGPGDGSDTPQWHRLPIDDEILSLPKELSAGFGAGTLTRDAVVVRVIGPDCYGGPALSVYATAAEAAREVFDAIETAARVDRNILRGRVLHATCVGGLILSVTKPIARDRASIVVPQEVWDEIDVNVAALTGRAELMRSLGLGTRRGILLAGPPGVGKSALSAAVAGELVGDFTVILVDASAAGAVLREVYQETEFLGPTVVVLEDVDLSIGDRRTGGGGSALADFLAVLDGTERYDDVLTIASTNDPAALDKAATRASRFDSVIHLDYPDLAARTEILRGLLSGLACAVDAGAVAAQIAGDASGADLREIVRRAVLVHGTALTTERLLEVIASGRWRPEPLSGAYL